MSMKDLRFAELEDYLENEQEILALYLFGSHSEGLAHVRSDMDLALLLAPEVDEAWYGRNWSLWLDLIILIRTVKMVLKREGVYRD